MKEFEKFRPLNNRTATHSKPPPLGEVARLAVPERAFLPSQSLRASSPKGRAIVLTAFKVGCNKTCLKPSNSDLSVRFPSGDRGREKVTLPVHPPPGGPGKIENRNDFLPLHFRRKYFTREAYFTRGAHFTLPQAKFHFAEGEINKHPSSCRWTRTSKV